MNNHFQTVTLPTCKFTLFNERWNHQYNPKDYIDQNIYSNILSPPTIDEWISIICSLPNDKAAGPIGIFNKHIKHLDKYTQNFLLKLIQMIITVRDIFDDWRIAHVYLILKPTE